MRWTHLLMLGAAAAFFAGCAGVDARREQRWAAFAPLRPDPEFRILPNRPLAKFSHKPEGKPVDSRPEEFYAGAPVVWESKAFEGSGLEAANSKFSGKVFELYITSKINYSGKLRAFALDEKMHEVGRADAEVKLFDGGAGWVTFEFPETFSKNEVKVLAVGFAE